MMTSGEWKTKTTSQATGCLLLRLRGANGSGSAPLHRAEEASGNEATNSAARRVASASASSRVNRRRGNRALPPSNDQDQRPADRRVRWIAMLDSDICRLCYWPLSSVQIYPMHAPLARLQTSQSNSIFRAVLLPPLDTGIM